MVSSCPFLKDSNKVMVSSCPFLKDSNKVMVSSCPFLKDSNKVMVSSCPFLSAFNNYQYKRQIFYCSINFLDSNKNYFKEFHTLNVTQSRILFIKNIFVTFTAVYFPLRITVTRDSIFTWILYISIQHTYLLHGAESFLRS